MEIALKEKIKDAVSDYTCVVHEIKKLKNELKLHLLKKKELSEKLLLLMKETNIECFETTNDVIVHRKKKVYQNVSKKYLNSVLNEKISDNDLVNNIIDIIMNNRKMKIIDELVCKEN